MLKRFPLVRRLVLAVDCACTFLLLRGVDEVTEEGGEVYDAVAVDSSVLCCDVVDSRVGDPLGDAVSPSPGPRIGENLAPDSGRISAGRSNRSMGGGVSLSLR